MTCQGPYRCPGCPTCAVRRRPLTAADEARIQRALRNDPPVHGPRPLRLVQADHEQTTYSAPQACDGSMTCDCPRCQHQRAVLINGGPKIVKQPWDVVRRAA
jgi:hypothetical protein